MAVTDARGGTVSTVYDAIGRPTALIDARGYCYTTLYDPVGRPMGMQEPLGQWTTYQYDRTSYRAIAFDGAGGVQFPAPANPHPERRIDARGRQTEYTLDLLKRPIVTAYSDGSRVTRTYDALGRDVRYRTMPASPPPSTTRPAGCDTPSTPTGSRSPTPTTPPATACCCRTRRAG